MKARITSLALLTALTLTACGGGGSTSETTTASTTAPAETTAEVLTDGLPEVDMNGFTLSILHHNRDFMTWCHTFLDYEEQTGDLIEDAIYNRNRDVEERFNCELVIDGEKQVMASNIQTLVLAGDSTYDIIMPRDYEVAKSIEYIVDFNEIPHLALDEDWWYPLANESFEFGGKLYAAANSISLSPVSRCSGFAFNKDVYDEMGMDKTPFEYVYDDEWTLDTFKTIAKAAYKDLNGDAQIDENDRFGIGNSSWKEVFARLINGSGVELISKDADGYPVFNLDTNETAIEKLMEIYTLASDSEIYVNKSTNADAAEAWGNNIQGTALFRLCHANAMGSTLRESNMNYGFVPNPKFDEEQDRYYSTTWAFEIMTLPKTTDPSRYENIGIILEALAFDSHTSVLEPYKEAAVKIKYAQDDDSLAMLDIAFNSMSFDLGLVLWEGTIANPVIRDLFAKGDGSIVSTLTEKKGEIDAILETFKESMEA